MWKCFGSQGALFDLCTDVEDREKAMTLCYKSLSAGSSNL